MARGRGTLTSRKGTSRNTRGGKKSNGRRSRDTAEDTENVPPPPARSRPVPRPLSKKTPVPADSNKPGEAADQEAVMALIALKKPAAKPSAFDQAYAEIFKLPVEDSVAMREELANPTVLYDSEGEDEVDPAPMTDIEEHVEEDDDRLFGLDGWGLEGAKANEDNGSEMREREQGSGDEDEADVDELAEDAEPYADVDANASAEELPIFDIPFEVVVPGKEATRFLSGVTSKTTFDELIAKVAKKMEIRPAYLSDLSYIPSYSPKSPKPKPKLLEEDEDWEHLKKEIHGYINEQRSKAKGKGKVKPFHIMIMNGGSEQAKPGVKKGKRGNDDDDTATEVLKGNPPRKEHEMYRLIEAKHQCKEHHRACYIYKDNRHYQYTTQELSTWAYLLANHKALLDTPPLDLKLEEKLEDKMSSQQTAKLAAGAASASTSTTTSSSLSEPPSWFGPMMAIFAATQRAPATPVPAPQPPSNNSPSATPQKRTLPLALAEGLPLLRDWLPYLDGHSVYGRHQDDFASFLPVFEKEKLFDVGDLLALDEQTLRQLTGAIGTANRLHQFANDHLDSLAWAKQRRI